MLLDRKQIQDFLPHREPFLFLDAIERINFVFEGDSPRREELVGTEVVARYTTDSKHPVFVGHFPGNPILPGVIQVEMMAQAGAFTFLPLFPDYKDRQVKSVLVSISEAKFKKSIHPGMELTIKSLCTRLRGTFISHEAKIYCGETFMSQAGTLCSIKIL